MGTFPGLEFCYPRAQASCIATVSRKFSERPLLVTMKSRDEKYEHLLKCERKRLRKEALTSFRPCFIIFAVVMSLVAIVQIVIGALYLGDCPVQRMIPIYLIGVGAGILLAGLFFRLCPCKDAKSRPRNPLLYLTALFLIVWFIVGNFWIFKNYLPDMSHPKRPGYCNKTLFHYAFWSKIAQLVAFVSWFPVVAYAFFIRPARTAKRVVQAQLQSMTDEESQSSVTPSEDEKSEDQPDVKHATESEPLLGESRDVIVYT